MTPNDFVSVLKTECADAAVDDCVEPLRAPQGAIFAQSLFGVSGLDPVDEAVNVRGFGTNGAVFGAAKQGLIY
ncbi:hypothetical protein GGR60_001797 [Xanthomonas arboricola]|uniref:hypothetical protein n=1 Tax=Xanthomonas TaxID=338 RepID=UPI000F8D9DE8|nr:MULTISPECIES: hypothetical protein [Xanthomonas]NJC37262.1 hypothetical protein [Xanthomonas euroxanthea]